MLDLIFSTFQNRRSLFDVFFFLGYLKTLEALNTSEIAEISPKIIHRVTENFQKRFRQ